jgi:DNA-binding SARP family transcriptional activator/tetratricopeptide (TPR) repeat protein
MSEPTDGYVRLQCIGDARVVTSVGEIDPSAEMLFATALYLILEGGARVSRKHLQRLLWPELEPGVAGHRLRQTLFKLRRAGFGVDADKNSRLFLTTNQITTDFEDFETTSCQGATLANSSLPIFATYAPRLSPEFNDWFDRHKDKIANRLAQRLLRDLSRSRASGDWVTVEQLSRAIVRYTPHNEEAILAAAESLAMRGDKLQAVRLIDGYLGELGDPHHDLRIAASKLRRRIVDRVPAKIAEAQFELPLLGRSDELSKLVILLNTMLNHSPRSCIVCGDAGIGKSRLVKEFIAFAALQGVSALQINCRASDSKRPLATILELVPMLLAMRGAIGSSPQTLEYLNTLVTHRFSDAARSYHESDEPLQTQLDVALIDLLDAVTDETPIIICIEDIHWIDEQSASVIERLCSRFAQQRLLLLQTSRLGESSQPFPESDEGTVRLVPLSSESACEFVEEIVRRRGIEISRSELSWIVNVAEGNPFFLHELANHCSDRGPDHNVPSSLTAILRQRVCELSDESLQVLQTCALLENHSTLENIESVLELPAHKLLHCIDDLGNAGMLSLVDREFGVGSGRIQSRHDLLSEVALGQLAKPARLYLHRRAAKTLETQIRNAGDASTLWSCAKHWQLAGDAKQAFRLAESCARHLLEAELPSEAAQAFSKAAEFCTTDADRLTVLSGKSRAHFQASDWTQLAAAATEAQSIKAKLLPEADSHDDLEMMLRRAKWQLMDWATLLSDSLDCLKSESTPAHRLEAGVQILKLVALSDDEGTASEAFRLMSAIADSESKPSGLALQARMMYHTSWGSLDRAVESAIDLVACERAGRDIGAFASALCNAAITFRVAGRFEDASNYLHEALSLADRHKVQLSKTIPLKMLGHLMIEQGRFDDARVWLHALKANETDPAVTMTRLDIGTIDARIALAEGRYEDANSIITKDLASMRDDLFPNRRVYWCALRVASELANSGIARAESLMQLEREHIATRRLVFQAFPSFTLYGGLVSIGQQRKASRLLDRYLTTSRREPWPAPAHILELTMRFIAQKKNRQS